MAGFLIPAAGKALWALTKALPTIGATGLGVGALGVGAGRVGSALGWTKTDDEVAEDRGYDLNKDKVEKTGKIGDWYRDVATGTNTATINELAETNAIDQVNQNTSTRRGDLVQRSSQLEGKFTDEDLRRQAGETEQEVDRLERASGKMDVSELIALNPTVSRATLGSNPSMAGVRAEIERTSPMSATNIEAKKDTRYEDTLRYQADLMGYNERKSDAQLAFQREQSNLNRQENIQLRMMDSSDRRADRRSADLRADRKERQLMILQMIKGIQQGVSAI